MIVEKWAYLPKDPHALIWTKFGTLGLLVDLITHDIFFGSRLRGFDSVRGRILLFSYLQPVAVNTVLALMCSL